MDERRDENLPVLADVRPIEREPEPGTLTVSASPAVQAAAVAATTFVAGAAAVMAVKRHQSRKLVRRRRRARKHGSELVQVVASRSFLVDVSVVDRG